LRAVKFS